MAHVWLITRRTGTGFTKQTFQRLQDDASICKQAAMETCLLLATFPDACLWTAEQVLDEDFWTEETASG